ncbi:protein of unknown function DUF763 [Desulfurococcus mucosus DSM 2162]|uniref:DUF763 domain-containing protein n=1 Tax=Desulfurococcus mucosus (strain ATCC 35584 / DSM 2162 / JCM 9187 / O7/1) TaxID=765177 RepID=E8R7Z6_DESM0|nr:protein of unknown function DUF763 [Desulfurococcus mucosus DSM 2162]
MTRYSGVADLPLHNGHVPPYLFERMRVLGGLIARYIVEYYGPGELVRRLGDPFWFQAFNNVIGMDWDSSGSTTVVVYVLKNTFPPGSLRDNGIAVLGGKGRDSRAVAEEAKAISDVADYERIVGASRMAAKIDGVALQDGYSIYIHSLIVDSDGDMLVVQQGLNEDSGMARRYHLPVPKGSLPTTRVEPHSGVASMKIELSLNLANPGSREARRAILDIVSSTPPGSLLNSLGEANRILRGEPSILSWVTGGAQGDTWSRVRQLTEVCPRYYRPVANLRLVGKAASEIKKLGVREFDELIGLPGVGAETIRALALVADLIYGYRPSLRDPTTSIMDPFLYAYAHGGKDGVPYPVRVEHIDRTIEFFASMLDEVKVGARDREHMLRRLASFADRVKRAIGFLEGSSDYIP